MKKQKKIFFPNKQPIVNRYLIKKPKEHSNNLIVRLIGQRLIVVLRREIEAIEKEIEDSNQENMYFHYQNLKKVDKETRYISHARFWLGQSPQLHCEWVVPGRDISCEIALNDYEETAIGGHIGLYAFTFYQGIEWCPLYRLLEKITRRRDQKYTNGRDIGFYISHGAVSVSLWNDPIESRRDDPWWWHQYFDLGDIFFGHTTCAKEVLEERNVLIPMPEKSYESTAKLMLYTWTRPRWFSKSLKRVEIDVPEGLPHEGKGENSWDMGVDRTFGMITDECHSIAEGVGKLVGSVLNRRVRYGGYGDWNWQKSD